MLDSGWHLQEAGAVVCTSSECSRNPGYREENPAQESQGELFLRNVLVAVLFPLTLSVGPLCLFLRGQLELLVSDYLGWLPARPQSCSALLAVGPTLSKAARWNARPVTTGCVGRERPLVDCQLSLPRPKRTQKESFCFVLFCFGLYDTGPHVHLG